MITKAVAVVLLAGLFLMFWSIPRAQTAEALPFRAAMVITRPGQQPEVRHLYESKAVCESDLTLEVRLVPSATRLECKPIERRK